MAHKILTDLDLTGNLVTNVADGIADNDIATVGQLNAAISLIDAPDAGAGLLATSPLGINTYEVGAGTGIVVAADAISVDPTYIDSRVTVKSITASNGVLAVDTAGDVALTAVQDPAADNILVASATGLYVPPPTAVSLTGYVKDDGTTPFLAAQTGVDGTVATHLATKGQVDTANATQDTVIGLKADKATAVTTGNGLTGSGTLGAPITISALADPALDNTLAVSATGLYVPPPTPPNLTGYVKTDGTTAFTAAQTGVEGTADLDLTTRGYVNTANATQDATIALKADATALTQEIADRTAGDVALGARIDGISVTGTGMAVASETGDNQWTVDVPAIQLSNTYTGPGTDAATINTDLSGRAPAVEGEPGDLYVNDTTGAAFLCTTAPSAPGAGDAGWTELAAATVGLDSIASSDASITITGGAGPAANAVLSTALQTAISTSTTTNTAQDAAILALQADTHVAATSGSGAIGVTGQAISLVIDPASVGLSQSATGLLALAAPVKSVTATVGGRIATVPAGGTGDVTVGLNAATIGDIDALKLARIVSFSEDAVIAGGVGSATVTHNLGTTDVVVGVWSGGCQVTTDVCIVDADSVTVTGPDGTLRVVVHAASALP